MDAPEAPLAQVCDNKKTMLMEFGLIFQQHPDLVDKNIIRQDGFHAAFMHDQRRFSRLLGIPYSGSTRKEQRPANAYAK